MDAAKAAFSVMGACAFGLTFVPHPLRARLDSCIRDIWEKLFATADPFAYIEVSRKNKGVISPIRLDESPNSPQWRNETNGNPFYAEVGLYLGSLNLEFAARRVCVYGLDHDRPLSGVSKFVFGLPLNETLIDTFEGAQFSWTHKVSSHGGRSASHLENDDNLDNVFCLRMLKSDKHRLLHPYLDHISNVACEIRQQNTLRSLYSNSRHGSHWTAVTLKHPSTFETIALDGDLAERIQADLKAFLESEAYYHSIGRAWKRGYLLYGPPGTGKSSLIAAIANHMHYDIYDLELTNVSSNSMLQNLLMQTKRKSIIVIEDIDCSMSTRISDRRRHVQDNRSEIYEDAPQSRSHGFTLSGLLNFSDGLLSCFGEERIFIFTTNHKERLDSALLRCGRMDMHIHLSYCTFSVLKKLVVNYLGIKDHALYGELEEAMKPGVKITPASVAEIFLSERKNPDEAIRQVLAAVKAGEETLDSADKVEPVPVTEIAGRLLQEPKERRRKFPFLESGGLHNEEFVRNKRQLVGDICAMHPLVVARDIGLGSSKEEFEKLAGSTQVAPTIAQEDGSSPRLQADAGVKKPAEDKSLGMVATSTEKLLDSAIREFSDTGFDRLARGAVISAAGNKGLEQSMWIGDSEGSSDALCRKRVRVLDYGRCTV